jgi:hypothetical protein
MSHPLKSNDPSIGRLAALLMVMPIMAIALPALPAGAHEVEISGDVGGTLHIEPNDAPHVGTASLAWFALTRRGGQPIPLSTCNCQLAVYAQPRRQGDTPLSRPTLINSSVEGRQNIPAANITFPRAGAYELILQGRPVSSGAFLPFELRFSVTVAQ